MRKEILLGSNVKYTKRLRSCTEWQPKDFPKKTCQYGSHFSSMYFLTFLAIYHKRYEYRSRNISTIFLKVKRRLTSTPSVSKSCSSRVFFAIAIESSSMSSGMSAGHSTLAYIHHLINILLPYSSFTYSLERLLVILALFCCHFCLCFDFTFII